MTTMLETKLGTHHFREEEKGQVFITIESPLFISTSLSTG